MSKKQKLKELLDKINALDGSFIPEGELSDLTNKIINQEVASATDKIRQNTIVKTLERITAEIGRLKKNIDVSSIIASVKELEKTISDEQKISVRDFEAKLALLKQSVIQLTDKIDKKSPANFDQELKTLTEQLTEIQDKFSNQVLDLNAKETVFRQELSIFEDKLKKIEDYDSEVKGINEKLKKLQTDLITRTTHVGGQANRQISVDSSVMSTRYTDLNFKISSSIGWTASDDNTFRRVDIVASILIATGGGGGSLTVKEADGTPNVASVTTIVVSNGTLTDDGGGQVTVTTGGGGGGITRTTSIITADTTGAAAASTDYVYFANAGIRFLLPTAISNTDLYTVKNTGSSSVLIVASVGQAIDGSATALLPTQNESLTFISNNSVWGVV